MQDLIQVRRDTAANWTSTDPILAQGEIGIELATYPAIDKFKIGDGVHPWSGLRYYNDQYAYSGYSARFGELIDTSDLDDTILTILDLQYAAPTISLSASPSQSLREKGDTVSSVDLVAHTVKKSDPITAVTFYRAGSLVNTVSSPSSGGGNENYTNSTSFADNMSFYAKVSDGTSLVQSNTVSFGYVYPYYYGVGAASLGAAVAGLTKLIIGQTSSVVESFSPTSEAMYIAFPASYPDLVTILDPNGFNITSGFTKTTASITGLDGNSVSYQIWESGITTQTAFVVTFRNF